MQVILIPDLKGENETPVIVPCLPEENIAEIIHTYFPDAQIDASVKIGSDETLSFVHRSQRIECVSAKNDQNASVTKAIQVYVSKNKSKFEGNATLLCSHISNEQQFTSAVQGAVLGSYEIGHYKTDQEKSKAINNISVVDANNRSHLVEKAQNIAETQKEIFGLVNAPSNYKSPLTLADWAVASGKKNGYSVTVFDEKRLKDEGFEGLLSVNRGSEIPARFIVCDYNPGNASKTAVIVGKGVTFDTGGVSLKPGHNMHLMKSDMGGAGAVLGAVELCAKQKINTRVIACVPTTDNSIGTNAIKPGDVIGSYSGKTIEVINTDAEGRLILADGLNYAVKHFSPDVIIDLATLTGSVVRTLGNYCAGLFTHDDTLAKELLEAGESCGERLWRLPLWEEYAEDMRSDVADIKNLSDKPVAGAITAAKFLEFFTDEHPHWAHIDIAGTAFKSNGIARNHAATAYGVILLYTFLEGMS